MPVSDHDAWTPVSTGDGSRTLHSARFGQTLHSHHGAVTEARWVFLRGSGVEARLAAGDPARVLEVGFGTGLNFLVTADAARRHRTNLRYLGLERVLPTIDAVAALDLARHLAHPELARSLWDALDGLERQGRHVVQVGEGGVAAGGTSAPGEGAGAAGKREPETARSATVRLDLWLGEATDVELPHGSYDAVYHDAFSPDVNPELWTADFLERLAMWLAPGGALVTYTVAGAVRRTLAGLGLEVEKRPGPPAGKREMLWARKPPTARG